MIIVAQNGKVAVNSDNVLAFEVQGKYVHAHPTNGGNPIPIAFCDTEDEAIKYFRSIIERIDAED